MSEHRRYSEGKEDTLEHDSATIQSIFPLEIYRETYQARADIRSSLSRALLQHPVGQFLVNNGIFTHPVLKEKDRQELAYQKLLAAYQDSALLPADLAPELITSTDPDMLPYDKDQIVLQKAIQKLVIDSLEYHLSMNSFESVEQINFMVSPSTDLPAPLESDPLAEKVAKTILDVQKIAGEMYYCRLRDKILQLAGQGNWALIVEMLSELHSIPQFKTAFTEIFTNIGEKLFAQPQFRRQITHHLIKQISVNNLDLTDSLSEFLMGFGFPEITDTEKQSILTDAYQHQLLDKMYYLDPQRYFDLVGYLYRYGLITEQFLHKSPLLKFQVIEFSLKALYGQEDLSILVNTIRPLMAEINVLKPAELTLGNQQALYSHYQSLCISLNKTADQSINALYRHTDRSDDWDK